MRIRLTFEGWDGDRMILTHVRTGKEYLFPPPHFYTNLTDDWELNEGDELMVETAVLEEVTPA